MSPRIRSITVKGFRAFGANEQTLNLPSDIAAVWGPNSKGKSSLAESFEFLLTGRIARRELMASSQDEFANALRNAHLPAGEDVYVSAKIIANDGNSHSVRRTLTSDYGKKQSCSSRLVIDGSDATEDDLKGLGIVLSQPPMEAPVLALHTLSYIFSVGPQNRATYFKTILEVTDLDHLRNAVASSGEALAAPEDPIIDKFKRSLPVLKTAIGMLQPIPNEAGFTAAFQKAAEILIENTGQRAPYSFEEKLAAIRTILVDRRSSTFPVTEFQRDQRIEWSPPPDSIWTSLTTNLDEVRKVEAESRQLNALFVEALKIPSIARIEESVDCPLCGVQLALTLDRVRDIRTHVKNNSLFQNAQREIESGLAGLLASIRDLETRSAAAMPAFLRKKSSERRKIGFSLDRLRELLGELAPEVVDDWLSNVRQLLQAKASLRRASTKVKAMLEQSTSQLLASLDVGQLQSKFSELSSTYNNFVDSLTEYAVTEGALTTSLNQVLDRHSDTMGWEDFLELSQDRERLRTVLIESAARKSIRDELELAITEIDRAKEAVLDDKFADYSALIQVWWERLRPNESTFFSEVKPRKRTKRTIDFKAGLSVNQDRSAPQVSDVIAVFSQSQLHCLGLAMFLARAEHEGLGFIILDDPVLSSDEDYRVHFNSTVLSELLEIPIQVVVLTQDHDTWEELEARFRHVNISNAQLYVENPSEGTVIDNTSDELLAKISRAKSLARGGHPQSRKECGIHLRDAGERFCKEMLVNAELKKGNTMSSLTDYDEKTLEWLCPRIEPLLDQDPSHGGKLEVFRNTVNNACHDNSPPSNAEMTMACGELRYLVKEYLVR